MYRLLEQQSVLLTNSMADRDIDGPALRRPARDEPCESTDTVFLTEKETAQRDAAVGLRADDWRQPQQARNRPYPTRKPSTSHRVAQLVEQCIGSRQRYLTSDQCKRVGKAQAPVGAFRGQHHELSLTH